MAIPMVPASLSPRRRLESDLVDVRRLEEDLADVIVVWHLERLSKIDSFASKLNHNFHFLFFETYPFLSIVHFVNKPLRLL
jgi:hypothetical protein